MDPSGILERRFRVPPKSLFWKNTPLPRHQLLQEGQPLAAAWAAAPVLCSETRQLVVAGEQSGELEQSLARALQRQNQRAQAKASQLIKILGTTIYVAAASLAIYVIFAFYSGYLALLGG